MLFSHSEFSILVVFVYFSLINDPRHPICTLFSLNPPPVSCEASENQRLQTSCSS